MSHKGPLAEPIRVLVVDDDPDVRGLTCDALGELSDRIEVDAVRSATAGARWLADHDVDCVVSDYEMAPTDGIEFLAQVRETHPELPFILFTGRGSEAVASEAISEGVTDYVQKRGGLDQYELLLNRIEEAVDSVRSQVSYREVFEKADVGLTIRDTETGGLLDANERYCELLGYDREELYDLGFDDLTADVDGYGADRAKEHLERVKSEGSHAFLWPDETSDGDVKWVEVSLSMAHIEGDERIFASVRDVTEHKRRADKLDAAQRRYEAVFNSPVAFTGILAVDGTLLDANDAALEFVDVVREEVVGEPFPETPWWSHSEDLRADLREWIEEAAAGNHVRYEADHRGPDGDLITIHGIIHPIEEDGEIVSLLVTGRDISQRHERERRIATIYEATQQFADATDRDEVARTAVDLVSDVLGRDATAVRWYDPESDALLPNTVSDLAVEAAGQRPVYPVEDTFAGRAFRTGEPVVREDLSTVDDQFDHGDVRSAMYVPIGKHGTLSVVDMDVDVFDETDVELAAAIAENARAALDRLEREPTVECQRERLSTVIETAGTDLREALAEGAMALDQAEKTGDPTAIENAESAWFDAVDATQSVVEAAGEPDPDSGATLPSVAIESWQRVAPHDAELSIETEAGVRAAPTPIEHLLAVLFRRAVTSARSGLPVDVAQPTSAEAVDTLDNSDFDGALANDADDGALVDTDDGITVELVDRPDGDGFRVIASAGGDVAVDQTLLSRPTGPPTPSTVDIALARAIAIAHGWDLLVADDPADGTRFDVVGVELD